MLYLDHAASSPLRPAAREAWLAAVAEPGNPASRHAFGRRAEARVARARKAVAALMGCTPAQLVFTATGTEANNLAILGAAAQLEAQGRPCRSLHTAIEHACVRGPHAALAARGWEVEVLPVDGAGRVERDALGRALARGPSLVSIMAVNNEMGAVQDLASLGADVRAAGAWLHVDAVQALGVLDPSPWDADLISVSAHKLGGPQGVGALAIRRDVKLAPVLRGAPQEAGRRPGTLAVGAIAAFGAAAEEALATRAAEAERLAALRDRLEAAILAAVPAARVLGEAPWRAPHLTSVVFAGVTGEALVEQLDLAGLAASTGAACTVLGTPGSPVLRALGLPEAEVQGSLRLSLGWSTTEAEVLEAAATVAQVARALMERKPLLT